MTEDSSLIKRTYSPGCRNSFSEKQNSPARVVHKTQIIKQYDFPTNQTKTASRQDNSFIESKNTLSRMQKSSSKPQIVSSSLQNKSPSKLQVGLTKPQKSLLKGIQKPSNHPVTSVIDMVTSKAEAEKGNDKKSSNSNGTLHYLL